MSILHLYCKRLLKQPFFIGILLVCILLPLGAHIMILTTAPSSFISLAILDEDLTEASSNFIEQLERNTLLKLELHTRPLALATLEGSRVDAILTIPKDFFVELGKKKLNLSYNAHNAVAPALVDVIAAAAMQDLGKQRLKRAVDLYLDASWQDAAMRDFDAYYSERPTKFKAILSTTQSLLGLKSQTEQRTVLKIYLISSYSLLLILLIVVRPLAQQHILSKGLYHRLNAIPFMAWRQLIVSRFVYGFVCGIPWILIMAVLSYHLQLNRSLAIFLTFAGFLMLLGYLEFMIFIYKIQPGAYLTQLITLGIILFPALFGGGMFPIDLLPKQLIPLVSWSPFFQWNALFYEAIISGTMSAVILLIALMLLILSLPHLQHVFSKNES